MIGDRTEHFEGKSTDLSALQSHIERYLAGTGCGKVKPPAVR
jgi:hypothetical protein